MAGETNFVEIADGLKEAINHDACLNAVAEPFMVRLSLTETNPGIIDAWRQLEHRWEMIAAAERYFRRAAAREAEHRALLPPS